MIVSGQIADRHRRNEPDRPVERGRVAPNVLGDDRKPERLARDRERRQDRLEPRGRPGHEREARRDGKLGEFVGREGVDIDLQREVLLAIGLQPQPGRAAAPVAEAHGHRVAGAQEAAADADQQRVHPRPDVEALDPVLELGAVARLDGGVVRRRRIGELRLRHVGGGAPGDLQHPGVVDAEGAGRIGERELRVRAGHERTGRAQRGGAHVLGQIGGKRHWAAPGLRMRRVGLVKTLYDDLL